MFDTMTMTKIVGAFCGALLVFLVGNWAASALYDTSGGGGHGDEAHAAYVIDTGEDEGGGEEEETGPTFAEALAAADSAKGEKAWSKCKACHKLEDGANGTGPHLYNVVGRDVAAVGEFGYSDALAGIEGDWTPEQLSAWLEDPKGFAPGNKMTFNGMSKLQDRADLIAYLIDNSPDYVPAEPAAAEEPAAEEQAAAEGAEEPAAEEGAAEEGAAEEQAAEEGAAEEPAAEEGAAEEPATEEGAAEEGAAEEGATEEGAAEEGATEEGATEEPAAEEGAAEEGAAEEGAAEEGAAEEPATEEQAAEEGAAEEPAGDSPIAAAVAAADIAAGEKAYRKCKACHVVDQEQNRVGPHLVGLVGRDIAGVADFKYSDALTALEGNWTLEALDAWLADPKGYAPGNKMSFAGMKDIEDRANVIAYIESQGQ